jgi:hypothetical protein
MRLWPLKCTKEEEKDGWFNWYIKFISSYLHLEFCKASKYFGTAKRAMAGRTGIVKLLGWQVKLAYSTLLYIQSILNPS